LTMSVEAKALQRQICGEFDMASIRPRVRERLLDAAEKIGGHPLVVFLELNLPPEDPMREPSWVPRVQTVMLKIAAERGGTSPFSLVIFTNRPHLYGEAGEPDPSRHIYAMRPSTAAVPEPLADVLGEAATQYGNIPQNFQMSSASPRVQVHEARVEKCGEAATA
jgi:hypothetical protein